MEHLSKALTNIRNRVWLVALFIQIIIGAGCWVLYSQTDIETVFLISIFIVGSTLGALIVGWSAEHFAEIPLKALGNAILHVAPSENAPAPQTDNLTVGKEYVSNLVYQLYQVASLQDNKILAEHKREATQSSDILTRLPLPLFVFNKDQIITFATDAALNYSGLESTELFGKPLYETIDLEFPSNFTLESWVTDCQENKLTDTAYWRRVRMKLKNDESSMRQFDMAGYYNRDNPAGIEFIVTIFDRSSDYQQEDDSLAFMALAVHELRTPLTLMRGYVEVFEDELEDKLDPEMKRFMHSMHGAADQLTAFVNNILNVARIQENQLTVKLNEEKWIEIVHRASTIMDMRAKAMDKTISYNIPDSLPTVAVDRVTVYEVLCNLIDNAIKYSGNSKEVSVVSRLNKDGLVETTITDHGVGIPSNVLANLFEKFHRNFQNRNQITGTGLGLYVCKTIVDAHDGDIWVKSKEGEGTTVSFTVKPYSMLAEEHKNGNNKDDMVRTAHGWIKNHSLYRR